MNEYSPEVASVVTTVTTVVPAKKYSDSFMLQFPIKTKSMRSDTSIKMKNVK